MSPACKLITHLDFLQVKRGSGHICESVHAICSIQGLSLESLFYHIAKQFRVFAKASNKVHFIVDFF